MKHREGAFRTGATALTRPLFAALWLLFFSQMARGSSSCEAGVWDIADAEDDRSGLVPFAPRLVASGPDASSLAYSSGLGAAFRFKVRVSDWFAAEDVALEVSDCDSPDLSKPDTSVADATEGTGCPYKIYSADFPFSATGGSTTSGDTCTFAVTELQDVTQVHGYVVVKANLTQTWLGADFLRTFQMPLGFYIDLETDFSVDVNVTVENANECYDFNDCNFYNCVLDSGGANLCDCQPVYAFTGALVPYSDAIPNIISACATTSVSGTGSVCQTDTRAPVCIVLDSRFTITLDDPGDLASNATLNLHSSEEYYIPATWDDCFPPNDPGATGISRVTRTITSVRGVTGFTNVTTELGPVYADMSIQNYVFSMPNAGEATAVYRIDYQVYDESDNSVACETVTANVRDTSPPVCSFPDGNYSSQAVTVRGTLDETWSALLGGWVQTLLPANFPASFTASLQNQVSSGFPLGTADYAQKIMDVVMAACYDGNDNSLITDAQGAGACTTFIIEDVNAAVSTDPIAIPGPTDSLFGDSTGIKNSIVDAIELAMPCNLTSFYLSGVGPASAGHNVTGCLAEGTYTVQISMVDLAENTNDCSPLYFEVDNTPPDLVCGTTSTDLQQWVNPLQHAASGGSYIDSPLATSHVAADSVHHKQQFDVQNADGTTSFLSPNYDDSFDFAPQDPADVILSIFDAVHRDSTADLTEGTHVYSTVTEQANFTSDLTSRKLFHPQKYQSVLPAGSQDELMTRLYLLYGGMDAVGNLRLCTAEYLPRDATPPELTCPTPHTFTLPGDTGPSQIELTESIVRGLFTYTDHAKHVEAWYDNAGKTTGTVLTDALSICKLHWTELTPSANATNLDANQGRSALLRRRVAGYVSALCDDPFETSPLAGLYGLDVATHTIDSTDSGAVAITTGPTWVTLSLDRIDSGTITIALDAFLDAEIVTNPDQNTDGHYSKFTEAPAADVTCDISIDVEDDTAPDISVACAGHSPSPSDLFIMGQSEATTEVGIQRDLLVNYGLMSTVLKDNSQYVVDSNKYEYVHLEPSYLSDPSDLTSTSPFARGTHPITYTAYDSSGNPSAECGPVDLVISDVEVPQPDQFCGVGNGVLLVPMLPNQSHAVYTLSFQVLEGQSDFSEWTTTLTGSTDASLSPSGIYQDNCEFLTPLACSRSAIGSEHWDCTAQLNLTSPGAVYRCNLAFEESSYEFPAEFVSSSTPTSRSCDFNLLLNDTQAPVLTCDSSAQNPIVVPYLQGEAYFSGTVDVPYSVVDNAGTSQNDTALDPQEAYTFTANFSSEQMTRDSEDGYPTRTVTHADAYGNIGACVHTFKFEDQEAPVFDTCLSAVTLNQDSSPDILKTPFRLTVARTETSLFSFTDNSYNVTDTNEVLLRWRYDWAAPTESWQAQGMSNYTTGQYLVESSSNLGAIFDATAQLRLLDALYGDLDTVWLPDLTLTLYVADTQSRYDGEENVVDTPCIITITFEDTRDPELNSCGDGTLDLVASTTANDVFFSFYSTALEREGSGTNEITLLNPTTECEPGFNGDQYNLATDNNFCPDYFDRFGGGRFRGGGLTLNNLIFTLGVPVDRTFTVDDARGNGPTTRECPFEITDLIVPEWRECVYSPKAPHIRTLHSSNALNIANDPASSTWEWNYVDGLTVDYVSSIFNSSTGYSTSGDSYPYPVDNSDQMDLGGSLQSFKDSIFFDTVSPGSASSTYTNKDVAATLTVVDSNPSNQVNCLVKYTIDDDVEPVPVCSTTDDTTLQLSDCDSDDAGVSDTNHKKTCRFTMTYNVAEDMALSQPCTFWDQKAGSCTTTGNDEYGPGLFSTTFSAKTGDLTAPFLASNSGLPGETNSKVFVEITASGAGAIVDWDGNALDISAEKCQKTVTIEDDVNPHPLHGETGFDDDTCVTPGDPVTTRYIRLLEGQTEVVIPAAVLPVPVAEDADAHNFKVTVAVTGDAAVQEVITGWTEGTQTFDDVDATTIRTRSNGTYTFTYTYEDGTENTAECQWTVRVLEQFEEPAIEALTVDFTVTEDSGSNRRRRLSSLLLNEGEEGTHARSANSPSLARLVDRVQLALAVEEQAEKEGSKRRNLAQNPPADANADATLIYYVSTTYPWIVDTDATGVSVSSSNTQGGLTNAQSISISYFDSIGCDPANRTRAAPEDVGTDGASGDGVCFTAWRLDVQNVNCESVEEEITLTHTAQCEPGLSNIFHYDSNGALSPTCLDADKSRDVAITIKAQQFCKLQMATVALQERTQVGDRLWMDDILNADSQGNEDYGNYYAPESITNTPEFLFDGAAPEELVEICMLLWVTSEQTSANGGGSVLDEGGIQFQHLTIDSFGVSSDGSSGWVAPAYSTFTNSAGLRTNMVGLCFDVTAPDLAFNAITEADTLTISVSGTATYDIASRRRRAALALESASLTASERVTVTLRDTEGPGKGDPLAPAGSGKSGGPSDGAAQAEPSLMRAVLGSLLVLCALTTLCQKKNYWRQVLANTPYAKDGSLQPLPQVDGWRGAGGDDGLSGRDLVLHDQGLREDQPFPETSPLTASVEESEMVSLSSSADF